MLGRKSKAKAIEADYLSVRSKLIKKLPRYPSVPAVKWGVLLSIRRSRTRGWAVVLLADALT